jgi:hypothetical protein
VVISEKEVCLMSMGVKRESFEAIEDTIVEG